MSQFKENKWYLEFVHRNKHHVSLLTGYFISSWSHKESKLQQNSLENALIYTYHIAIFEPLSYFLGSVLGYSFDLNAIDGSRISYGKLILPGFLMGLSYSFSTRFKINLGINFSLLRYFKLKVKNVDYQFNMRALPELMLSSDYFFSKNWALTTSLNYKKEELFIEKEEIKENLKELYGDSRSSWGALFGLTYHRI